MKFTPEVIAALAVLREHADNDFERHRIDVLERDLTAPPTVEVIDDKHQRFNGVVYGGKSSGHFVSSQGVHRDVWTYCNGEIPEGHEIHHIDENKANNAIENLQLLTKPEHNRVHLTRLHQAPRPSLMRCEHCGKPFTKSNFGNRKYCSPECCRQAQDSKQGGEKICVVCGKIFQSADPRIKCCSVSCGNKLGHSLRGTSKEKICPICGKPFIAKRAKQRYCSPACGCKGRERH